MCVTLNVLTTTYKTLKMNNADVDCILLNILNYCNLVINPLQTLIMPVVKPKLWFRGGIFYEMYRRSHIHINVQTNSHQVGLFISMTESPSLSMSTRENLAFLWQEHWVKFAKDHLQGKEKIKINMWIVKLLCLCLCLQRFSTFLFPRHNLLIRQELLTNTAKQHNSQTHTTQSSQFLTVLVCARQLFNIRMFIFSSIEGSIHVCFLTMTDMDPTDDVDWINNPHFVNVLYVQYVLYGDISGTHVDWSWQCEKLHHVWPTVLFYSDNAYHELVQIKELVIHGLTL